VVMGGSADDGPATRILISSVSLKGLDPFFNALEAMPFKGQEQPCHYVRFVFSAADAWDEGACTSDLPSGQPGVFYRTYGDSGEWTETLEVGAYPTIEPAMRVSAQLWGTLISTDPRPLASGEIDLGQPVGEDGLMQMSLQSTLVFQKVTLSFAFEITGDQTVASSDEAL